jgi:dihydroorotate dehydrogenase (NAD+) catalytic subunit
MKNYYQAEVSKCQPERQGSPNFLLELELEESAGFTAEPGQFVVLEPLNKRSVMPRPFSVVLVQDNTVTLLIKAVGENTKAYSQLKPGEKIRVIGPEGSLIPIEPEVASYILVGGGIGGAALVAPAKRLSELNKLSAVLLGARDESELAGLDFFHKYGIPVITITEIGAGTTGLVTDLLEKFLKEDSGKSTVITCGPKPMLKAVAEMSAEHGNQCLVMLEEIMACGMGSCKGCAVIGKDETVKHVCSDGPAIDADWIDWEAFLPTSVSALPESAPLQEVDMTASLGALTLAYPTMNASGCLAIGALEQGRFDYSRLGALVTKGVTVAARAGNQMPRTCETPAGMINSIGLENIGLKRFLTDELPRWLVLGLPVLVNISGFTLDEYVILARAIDKTKAVGVEVNISCPNIKQGGITFGIDSQAAYDVTRAVRQATSKLVIVKLTPNVTDITLIAKAVVRAGADAISLINTLQAMAIDPLTRRPRIATVFGGLSGPAIRPVAVRMVRQLYQADLGVPLIAMGGIEDGSSAAEFFIAGANMIAAGTGGFSNRWIFKQIIEELEKIITYHGFSSANELVGSLITP